MWTMTAGEMMIVALPDLLEALQGPEDTYVVTHSKHFFNDVFVGPELRAYVLKEMERVDDAEDDLRVMIFRKEERRD